MRKKIAFMKLGIFSNTNKSVELQFIKKFPEFELEKIEIVDLILSRIDIILINIFFIIKEYGLDILSGKKKFRQCFFKTSYIFKKIKEIVSVQVSKEKYAFSFQTQSLFDGSIKGLPHFVYTDHTVLANLHYPYIDKRKVLYSKPWIKLEKTIYQNASRVFTMSENISNSIIEQYSCKPDKVVCVYVGSNARVTNELPENKNYKNILFIGKNWENKGGPELVEAFKLVLKVHPDARLTIVGCSPSLNVSNCDVIGPVSVEKVNEYYRKSSVFCLPTKLEAFGIVYIEAMAHKIPVIGSNNGARPEFILNGKNGYLVDPNNIEQIAKALIDLIGNPKKCKIFGEKGYSIANEKYTWDKVGIKLKKNIKPLISI